MHGTSGQVFDTGQLLDAPLDARERSVGLDEGGGRQEHVHVERRQVQVLSNEKVAVGSCGKGSFAHQVENLGPATGPQTRQRESLVGGGRSRTRQDATQRPELQRAADVGPVHERQNGRPPVAAHRLQLRHELGRAHGVEDSRSDDDRQRPRMFDPPQHVDEGARLLTRLRAHPLVGRLREIGLAGVHRHELRAAPHRTAHLYAGD